MSNNMYFTGKDIQDIIIDDPIKKKLFINQALFLKVLNDEKLNTRVFLDTPLLKIHNNITDQEFINTKHVSKSNVSVSLGAFPLVGAVVYITQLLTTAEFREMSIDRFKANYLAPLDKVIKESNSVSIYLKPFYDYPFGNPMSEEDDIQGYFDREISGSLLTFYRDIHGIESYFGRAPLLRPSLHKRQLIKPDIVHMLRKSSSPNFKEPEICFAIGDYKNGSYYLKKGFEELKLDIMNYKLCVSNQILQRDSLFFRDFKWSEKISFALVLRKYLYDAFICGTDRVFISDHQSFSGFFQYEFIDDHQMAINYYVINDPETVAHGITLRSALAGFFYRDLEDAYGTKERLSRYFKIASKVVGTDPFDNVMPKHSQKQPNSYHPTLSYLKEDSSGKEEEVIDGNTICRVIHDAPECYPTLDIKLPSKVFVKLYHYSSRSWEMHELFFLCTPTRDGYYEMFFNELLVNEKISQSQYASNFAKLFASGYWNGLHDHPMHIFEYLGKELPRDMWNEIEVYKVIRTRIKELHSLGITHNDIKESNIHVSMSGKISLIDFGLSDCENSDHRKKQDLDCLDRIFKKGKYSTNENLNDKGQSKENIDDDITDENNFKDYENKNELDRRKRKNILPTVQRINSSFFNR